MLYGIKCMHSDLAGKKYGNSRCPFIDLTCFLCYPIIDISEYLLDSGGTDFWGESIYDGQLGSPNPTANPIGVHQACNNILI